jgi:hypothetical protein
MAVLLAAILSASKATLEQLAGHNDLNPFLAITIISVTQSFKLGPGKELTSPQSLDKSKLNAGEI